MTTPTTRPTKRRVVLQTAGHSAILRAKAHAVSHPHASELRLLRESLLATLIATGGVGLAAPQIGVGLRVCLIAPPGMRPFVLVNPTIVEKSATLSHDDEGCLSVPGTWARQVPRASWVKLDYQTPSGARKRLRVEGLVARIVQHELDHLDGRLILDLVPPKHLVDTPTAASTAKGGS